jgi:hypothetical protein
MEWLNDWKEPSIVELMLEDPEEDECGLHLVQTPSPPQRRRRRSISAVASTSSVASIRSWATLRRTERGHDEDEGTFLPTQRTRGRSTPATMSF